VSHQGPAEPNAAKSAAQPLQYGRARRPLGRRQAVRLLVIIVILIAAAWAGLNWSEVRHKTKVVVYWRQCMNHEWDVKLVASTAKDDVRRLRWQAGYQWSGGDAVHLRSPHCWEEITRFSNRGSLMGPGSLSFLHERRTPGGKRRLVAASFYGFAQGYTLTQDGVLGEPKLLAKSAPPAPLLPIFTAQVRVFAGSADAADPTHFTIPYEVDGVSGVLHGWLQNDDTIRFEARGPTTTAIITSD
jgi:hypothetical protein